MNKELSYNLIAPSKCIRGESAWNKGKELIPTIGSKPLLISRSKNTTLIINKIKDDLNRYDTNITYGHLNYDCCEFDLTRLEVIAKNNNCDSVIGCGGGKVLDASKLLADRLCLPCITIPLSAATCAGWTALSNIYSPQGAYIRDQSLKRCPELIIFDYQFIRTAPKRTLASGIADALAKWYEASLNNSQSKDVLVQQAVQMARVLRDQLFIDSAMAMKDRHSDSWTRVAESCGLTAGLIGGIGGASCRTAVAHALHNGLTQIPSIKQHLHGEIVGYGILIQLYLEEISLDNKLAKQARLQLLPLFKILSIPTSLNELGLAKINIDSLKEVCNFAFNPKSDIHKIPFDLNQELLLEAMINSNKIRPEEDNLAISTPSEYYADA